MAKDKAYEAQYKAEGRRRSAERKLQRVRDFAEKRWKYGPGGDATCPNCGNAMSWCSICQVFTRICCVEYGTCQCS